MAHQNEFIEDVRLEIIMQINLDRLKIHFGLICLVRLQFFLITTSFVPRSLLSSFFCRWTLIAVYEIIAAPIYACALCFIFVFDRVCIRGQFGRVSRTRRTHTRPPPGSEEEKVHLRTVSQPQPYFGQVSQERNFF